MVSYPDHADRAPRNSRLPFQSSSTQRAPSTASSSRLSSSTVRRHRHGGRSRHGGSGSGGGGGVQNEFPVFGVTGDVEIILKSRDGRREQKYVLHRLILSQNSGFFEASTSDEWNRDGHDATTATTPRPRNGTSTGEDQPNKRWRYELDYGRGDDDTPVLIRKPVPSTSLGHDTPSTPYPPPLRPNKPTAPSNGFFRSMANFSALHVSSTREDDDPTTELFRTYNNLFLIFYNYAPSLDNANIANAYVECKSLLHLADIYDSLDIIGPRVDHHLLRFQGRLWKQIAKYPPSYLKLAYLARSRDIFREALVHVVGQWPAGERQLRGQVPQTVMELVEDKVDELEETKARVEAKLWRLTLTTSRGERVNPGNDWIGWLVMSFWRQWFAEGTTPAPVGILKGTTTPLLSSSLSSSSSAFARPSRDSRAGASHSRNASVNPNHRTLLPQPAAPAPQQPINTGRVFRLIGAAGPAYLAHDDVKRFLKQAGPDVYNRENLRRAERRMEEMKNLARAAVQPLMRNFLELNLGGEGGGGGGGSGLGYLTCTRVDERDWPWEED